MQDSSTSQLIFRVDETIAYLSKIMTLEPGDLIFTGTPPGVGMAKKPPVWLKPGDVVEVEIDGLGTPPQHGQGRDLRVKRPDRQPLSDSRCRRTDQRRAIASGEHRLNVSAVPSRSVRPHSSGQACTAC